MRNLVTSLAFLFSTVLMHGVVFAQGTIAGQVINQVTRQGIEGADLFFACC